MKIHSVVLAVCSTAALLSGARAAQSTGTPFYGDPPDQHHPWGIHDRNRPQPVRVEPGTFSTQEQPGKPPADAIVLFDGTQALFDQKWESDTKDTEPKQPAKWLVKDGALEVVPKTGMIRTKEEFGDCQVHVEWAAPAVVKGDSQGRGNSGIFLLGIRGVWGEGPEVQVLDNYNNPTYADGFATSVYGTNPPLANALRPPGQFQSIDIVFRRPVYRDGKMVETGYITVFCNGVLVQDHTPLEGRGGHQKRSVAGPLPERGPLKLQDHGDLVRFRNIWYRPLPPRASEGGTDGYLTAAATTAKRQEIAASIRADAAKLKGQTPAHFLRLAESLVYAGDAAAKAEFEQLAQAYAAAIKATPAAQLSSKEGEVKSVVNALKYLGKHAIVPDNFGPRVTLEGVVTAQGWDQVKK